MRRRLIRLRYRVTGRCLICGDRRPIPTLGDRFSYSKSFCRMHEKMWQFARLYDGSIKRFLRHGDR